MSAPVKLRSLKAEVLLSRIEALSSPSNSFIGRALKIRNSIFLSLSKMRRT